MELSVKKQLFFCLFPPNLSPKQEYVKKAVKLHFVDFCRLSKKLTERTNHTAHNGLMKDIKLPISWFVTSINDINSKLASLPDVRMGSHGKYHVLWLRQNNKRYEIRSKNKNWSYLLECANKRQYLMKRKKELYHLWSEYYEYPLTGLLTSYRIMKKSLTLCNSAFWNNLTDNKCNAPNDNQYYYDGHNFRSRIEMNIAQAAKELGIQYKYDCELNLGNIKVYPDFAFHFDVFDCCVFLEILGNQTDTSEIRRNGTKLDAYSKFGFLFGRDLFLIGATNHFMPNHDSVHVAMINIINHICSLHTFNRDGIYTT